MAEDKDDQTDKAFFDPNWFGDVNGTWLHMNNGN
jgi:hypothetical protein